MNIVVNIKTTATHDKEYKGLEFTQWHSYKIAVYKVGDSLPSDSIFLTQNTNGLVFKIPRPRPRSLPVLDNEISSKASLYFQPTMSTASKFLTDLEQFVKQNIFTSEHESMWYYKYREFEVEMSEDLVVINIVGKS